MMISEYKQVSPALGKTTYSVAVLMPHSSPAMQHYVERIAACLHVLLPHGVTVRTIDILPLRREHRAFNTFLRTQEYDFYLSMGAVPSSLYCAAVREGITTKPGMILSDEELFVPSNVMNACLPNNGELLSETLMSLLPGTKKVFLCGSRYSLEKAADLQTIREVLTRLHVPVELVCITTNPAWKKAFVGAEPHTTVAVTSFEPKMFEQLSSVVAHARMHKVFTIATNVFAIHEGVDFAFGYPENTVFRRVSEKIVACLREGVMASEVLSLTPSLHCNVANIALHEELRRRVEQIISAPKGPIKIHLHANKEARR